MSNTPIIMGTGRIDIDFSNSTFAKPAYRYQIRTDGIKFIDPETQNLISAFELVEQQLANDAFGLKSTSYAKLNLFFLSLDTHFAVNLIHKDDKVILTITQPNTFGPTGDKVFKGLNLIFVESKVENTTTLTATGQVTINFLNNDIVLQAEFLPDFGLRFYYDQANDPSLLKLKKFGVLELAALTVSQPAVDAPSPQVLFTFDEGSGNTIFDSALDAGQPINLAIEDKDVVNWLDGGLMVNPKESSLIASTPIQKGQANPIKRLVEACQKTNELAIEAWIKPTNTTQEGPARIITLSQNTGRRNFTLGQGLWDDAPSDVYDARIRTSSTNLNGIPSTTTPAKTLTTDLTHVVVTRRYSGEVCIYVNGVQRVEQIGEGSFANWEGNPHRLALANELVGERPWAGDYYYIAIYDQALSEPQVASKFAPEIIAEGTLTLDDGFGIVAQKRFKTLFDYNLAEERLRAKMDISAELGSQLSFNSLSLEWQRSPDKLSWQLTGQGQVNLTIMGQTFDFVSQPEQKAD
ncbi:MAG: LamG domain-containing protein [Anaerolineales bacterium]|nr:LamG domain-containing protein [Anaerolineales bacterium]